MQVKQEPKFWESPPCSYDYRQGLESTPWAGNINDTYSVRNQACIMQVNDSPSVNGNANNNFIQPFTKEKTLSEIGNSRLRDGTSSNSNCLTSCMVASPQNIVPNMVPTFVYANDDQHNVPLEVSSSSLKHENKKDDHEMSHALPKRIAQMQQKCQYQSRKQKLAQPKHAQKDKKLVFHHYSNAPGNDNREQSHPNQGDSGCFRKCTDTNKLNQEHTFDKQTMQEHCDDNSMEGLFGWTQIDNVYIPYIFRSDNEKYVCVRLLEQKILKKYPNVFPKELAVREPLTSSFITMNECKVFNQLVRLQNRGQATQTKFDHNDVVVSLSDFVQFYSAVRKVFRDWSAEIRNSPINQLQKCPVLQSGWMQVNNTIVPFIKRQETNLLPLAVLKHAAAIEIRSEGIIPTDDECEELNRRCSEEGFKFVFKSSSKLVPLHEIKHIPNVQLFELPEKDPLNFTQYLQTEDQNPDGMKLNVHQASCGPYGCPHDNPNLKTLNKMDNQTAGHTPPSFVYNRFPSSIHNGSPNVTLVPEDRCPPVAHRAQNRVQGIPLNQENIHHFNIGRSYEYPHERTAFGQRALFSSLPPGQNINVNYGINIQNISSPSRLEQTGELTGRRNNDINIATEHNVSTESKLIPPNQDGFNQETSFTKPNEYEKLSYMSSMTSLQPPAPATVIKQSNSHTFTKAESGCTYTVNMQPMVVSTHSDSGNDTMNNNGIQNQQSTYQMKQKQAINELLTCIKGVWLCGKNISCMHLVKPGRSGKFCLVEAICKLYYGNTTVSHFLFTIESVLATYTCSELEEKAFIQYYQLPVNVLKCNKMIELSAFEKLYPQLTEVLKGVGPVMTNVSSKRCLLPLPDMYRMSLSRKRFRHQLSPKKRGLQSQSKNEESSQKQENVIVLDDV